MKRGLKCHGTSGYLKSEILICFNLKKSIIKSCRFLKMYHQIDVKLRLQRSIIDRSQCVSIL